MIFLVTPINASDNATPGTSRINLTAQVITRDKIGSIRFAAYALYNKPRYSNAIGNSISRCSSVGRRRTLPKGTQLCTNVYRLPLGQVIAMGLVTSPIYYKMAITGGTGEYKNIGGEVLIITTKLKPRKEKLVFTVIGL